MLLRLAFILSLAGLATADLAREPLVEPRAVAEAYDYIIVGAGTSGMTLAGRLSEDPSVTVAILEAGIDYKSNLVNQQLTTIPGADVIGCGADPHENLQGIIDWGFITTPQSGGKGRKIRYARGKCIGGTSARNFLLYQRPTRQSHDQWVQLTGDSEWSFDARLDDYKKTIKATGPRAELRKDIPGAQYNPGSFSAAGGPVEVSFPNYAQPFSGTLQRSMNEIGIPTINDQNGGKINGVQYATCTIEANTGQRSTSRAMYDLVKSRGNIDILTKATAKKVLFDTTSSKPRANGVVFMDRNRLFPRETTITAHKEVILSAGAFNTPQLLMTSGIGPRAQLNKYDIDVLIDNPNVGQNMEDHIFFGPSYPVKVETLTKLASNPVYLAAQYANFSLAQLGPMTNNVADLIAFERFSDSKLQEIGAGELSNYPKDWPTTEYLSAPGYVGDFGNLFADNLPLGLMGFKNYATVLAALIMPRSKGSVTLQSADTKDLPIINPNWLTDPIDQKVAVESFKRARAMFASKAMQPILEGAEKEPGLRAVSTNAQILDWIRGHFMTVWHPASTARMGRNANVAVADSQFRVFGVDDLRVVDASAFPSLLPGHPQSVCYMIAERAATLILAAK